MLIQKLYTSFKKAPGNYKLGVLYVVDSVTRLWIEQARKPGQPNGADAVDGTFASGVNHVTDLMPAIMTDIINTAPQDQKVSINVDLRSTAAISTLPCVTLCRCVYSSLFLSLRSSLLKTHFPPS